MILMVNQAISIDVDNRKFSIKNERFSKSIQELPLNAVREEMNNAWDLAKKLTGTQHFTYAQLKEMGHPYSKRAPAPPMPRYILSRQSGEFFSSWRKSISHTRNGAVGTLYNIDPKSTEIEFGNETTIPRGIFEYISIQLQNNRKKVYDKIYRDIRRQRSQ